VLQLIGLIIAVYAVCRLAQAPLVMVIQGKTWEGLPFSTRFTIVVAVSSAGAFIIALLTLLLLSVRVS
jgi:hypothetical protein